MKKTIVCLSAYLMIVAVSFKPSTASEGNTAAATTGTSAPANEEAKVTDYISAVYKQIDFKGCNALSYEVFQKAYNGYLNLRDAGKLGADKDVITICDFSLASTEPRMWVIDLAQNKVLFNTYVAHGQGSGDVFATSFSNKMNSHQSSLGFYVTGDTYNGKHGLQLRLNGMDQGFNHDALDRGVVVHGSKYVSEQYVQANNKLGRSWGCPAVSNELAKPIIQNIKGGTCLFIYSKDEKYQQTAYWMNKKATNVPENMYAAVMAHNISKPKTITYQYMTNGKVDSVKQVIVAQ
ncbi:MAG: murein L,D-transpeptidase catalytic domain family protein [Bacteroidota bacterium]